MYHFHCYVNFCPINIVNGGFITSERLTLKAYIAMKSGKCFLKPCYDSLNEMDVSDKLITEC